MTWTAAIPIPTGNGTLPCILRSGQVILFTGPNGVGKSALIHNIYRFLTPIRSELFPGHRQIHFQSDDVDTLGQTFDALTSMGFQNLNNANRYRDAWSEIHLKSVVKRLVESENQVNRDATSALRQLLEKDESKIDQQETDAIAKQLAFIIQNVRSKPSPIDRLNEIFGIARLEVRLLLVDGLLKARREGNTYGLDRLSDGERAALLLVAAILVRPHNTIILIDELEKHLNQAIFGGLIAAVVRSRPDLGFIFSSHELSLVDWLSPNIIFTVKRSVLAHPEPEMRQYEIYQVKADDGVPEDVKRSILGTRKRVLFVEGDPGSDDSSLYGLLLRDRSVIAKGGWETVVSSVKALFSNPSYHWLAVNGLIDNDGRSDIEQARLSECCVCCLQVPTLENLFFLEPVVQSMAELMYSAQGGPTVEQRLINIQSALAFLLSCHKDEIISLRVVWIANRILSERKISVKSIISGQDMIEHLDLQPIISEQRALFDVATQKPSLKSLEELSIKKTGIPARISSIIGFGSFADYKTAVLHRIEMGDQVGAHIAEAMRKRIPEFRNPSTSLPEA